VGGKEAHRGKHCTEVTEEAWGGRRKALVDGVAFGRERGESGKHRTEVTEGDWVGGTVEHLKTGPKKD
jgi:hypothetical protein